MSYILQYSAIFELFTLVINYQNRAKNTHITLKSVSTFVSSLIKKPCNHLSYKTLKNFIVAPPGLEPESEV